MSREAIVFRVDASDVIGTGHVVRCLTLASSMLQYGLEIVFVCRRLPAHLSKKIESMGIAIIVLDCERKGPVVNDLAHSAWLSVSQEQDVSEFLETTAGLIIHTLVIDHYALDYRWESMARSAASRLLVIDDLEDRHHDCDFLLDQNMKIDNLSKYEDLVPRGCKILLGPKFCLLREEFQKMRRLTSPKTGKIGNVFVFFGGVDIQNHTEVALGALSSREFTGQTVDAVIGESHPRKEQIIELCEEQGFNCHVQTAHMAQLMLEADLAIGSAGTVSWERCALGLPCITYAVSANQVPIAKALSVAGAIDFDEKQASVTASNIQSRLRALIASPSKCRLMSEKALLLADGLGTQRVCHALGLHG